MLKEAERLSGGSPAPSASIRERHTRNVNAQAKLQREIVIGKCEHPELRARAEQDVYYFLERYFPHKFFDPFTDDTRHMIEVILAACHKPLDQSIAAARGEGKTSITEALAIYCIVCGLVPFVLLVAATGPDAERSLRNIKDEFETNELLKADFPEVCNPIWELDGAPQRANQQAARLEDQPPGSGKRTRMVWSVGYVVFPRVTDSKASGSVIEARGLDAAIRGLNRFGKRPRLVIIDDAETHDSARSLTQTADRERVIERDIGGLGRKKLSRVMLCTIQNRTCLAWKYTDPKQKPSWNGQRYQLLPKKPDREDLWEEYMRLRQDGQASGQDRYGEAATKFYLDNREAMDAGALVGNTARYEPEKGEYSALQHCYNLVADLGVDAFRTEYQNDPPEEEGPQTSGLTAHMIEQRIHGLEQRQVPAETMALVASCDVGKYACHWEVTAWLEGATGLVVDHGVLEVHGTTTEDDHATVDRAILNALHRWREDLLAVPYREPGGIERRIDMAPIDSGDHATAVYQFVKEVGGKPFIATKGIGNFRPGTPGPDRIVGNHWFASHQKQEGIWLYVLDADHWKQFVHDRFLTPTFDDERTLRRGSMSLWRTPPRSRDSGPAPRPHHAFARHIVAEEWREEFVPGKGLKRGFFKVNKNNHWLDATAMNAAAGDMCGVKLLANPPSTEPARLAPTTSRFTTPGGQPYLLTER